MTNATRGTWPIARTRSGRSRNLGATGRALVRCKGLSTAVSWRWRTTRSSRGDRRRALSRNLLPGTALGQDLTPIIWGPVAIGTPVSGSALARGGSRAVGITGTPVADPARHRLHVVDIPAPTTGTPGPCDRRQRRGLRHPARLGRAAQSETARRGGRTQGRRPRPWGSRRAVPREAGRGQLAERVPGVVGPRTRSPSHERHVRPATGRDGAAHRAPGASRARRSRRARRGSPHRIPAPPAAAAAPARPADHVPASV